MDSKADIRKNLLQQRLALPIEMLKYASQSICESLKQEIVAYSIASLHYYEPIHRLHEIDILPFIDYLTQINSDLILHTSRKIDGLWQTVHPGGATVPCEPFYDCVIVPMLGFDKLLNRVGYGGGYYDRLLTVQPSTRKVGVCIQLGYQDRLPSQSHDIPMDEIITERQIYRK